MNRPLIIYLSRGSGRRLHIYFEQTLNYVYIFSVGRRRLRSSAQAPQCNEQKAGPSSEPDPPPAGRPPPDDELGKFVCLFREESYT